ncbi:tetratricopeptide repeat protein [Kaistella sp.]|uniref:tetratricopeptide repeat protein n=1 Tax=Kaistella sp. TaxID=2782235 RepID=UPI0035A1B009
MAIKYFTSLLLLLSAILLQAQKIRLSSSDDKVSDWEQIINQKKDSKSDIASVKNFLQPLIDRNSESDQILYDVLLANAYAENVDRVNDKSGYYYTKAIRHAAEAKLKPLEIWATLSYAGYLYNYRQMTKALPIFLAAIDKIEKTDINQLILPAESFTKIGFYMDTIGDDSEAIAYLKIAQEYTKPNTSEYAAILDNLGMSYFRKGELKNAEKNIRQSSTLSKSIGDQLRYAKTLGNLAQIYERNKDHKTAIQLVLEDVRISKETKSEKNLMYAYTLLTRLYIANNQIDEAKVTVKKACEIATSKSYFKINELDILKLRLTILQNESREHEELGIRRRIEILEDSLNKTDGVLPLNQANWLMQKRKYQQNIASTNQKFATESFWKNVIFATASLVLLGILFVFFKAKNQEKKKRVLMEEKIVDYENSRLNIERKLLDANRTLDSQIDFLKEKNIQIQKLYGEIENIKESKSSFKDNDRVKLDDLLQSHLMTEENWRNFKNEFQREHLEFYDSLIENFPEITDSNLRIILLQKLGFTNSEISGLLGITIDAVKKSKQRLKRKLGEKYDLLFQMIVSDK